MRDPKRFAGAPEVSPLGSLVWFHDFARSEEQNRRLQARIEDAEIHNRRLRSELDRTKAELELVTAERDSALLRLDELGSEL